jgi:glycosyltransferase A (GT-A) superfamily protein (DUF2064 family)
VIPKLKLLKWGVYLRRCKVIKHAIIIFTKVPEAGKVKTRLTAQRGGILTQEEAKDFYEACLLDTIDVCTSIDRARVWICHNAAGDRNNLNLLITQLKHTDKISGIFSDQGGSFDECMQYAAEFILKPGQKRKLAESILILGGDVVGLQPSTLNDAIEKLEMLSSSSAEQQADIGPAMVVSADQEGGFNLAGFTCNTDFDFQSVFYNMDGVTALEGLAQKARGKNIPLLPLDMVIDVDLPVDLGSMIPVLNVLEQGAGYDPRIIAPSRTIAVIKDLGLQSCAQPVEGWG